MKGAQSISTRRAYGVQRICRVHVWVMVVTDRRDAGVV